MSNVVVQYGTYLIILIGLAIPLGKYIGKVMNGEKVFLSKVLLPAENGIYKILGISKDEEMHWKEYAISVGWFSIFGFIILFALNLLQGALFLNPEGIPGTSWHLAFNTASSFVTNTNWQSYSGEMQLSYLTQMLGLTVQNFVSAATGIAVLFALIRGITRIKGTSLGSFWVDMVRSVLYVLIPLSIVVTMIIASQGVVQSFSPYEEVALLEPITMEDGTVVTSQVVPLGPAASQVAIKQLGTNGGGFMGTNSAHPLENPSPLSNLAEMISLLLIPAALCFSFGRNVKDRRQGRAIFIAMLLMLVIALGVMATSEINGTPQLAQGGDVSMSMVDHPGGNMEGKETRFGIATSTVWATFTTAVSNGSVNSMHDSYTPIGGLVTMLQMQLGEVIFGGVGCGLYGMLAFAMITVFIAGLMVGRTPEYLGKKIEPFEMKMAMVVCLIVPLAALISTGIACLVPSVPDSLTNSGIHGFSEVLYAFSSAAGNNGSAFAGLNANVVFFNVAIGTVMLIVRFIPIVAILAIAGSLVKKKKMVESSGTLPTHDGLFIGSLVVVVLLIGALSFFPALALGPLAEFFQMIG